MSLTFDEARHFLSRTAFGGTPEEIRRVMPLDRVAAVEQASAISDSETLSLDASSKICID